MALMLFGEERLTGRPVIGKAHPHIWMPKAPMGFSIDLYINKLLLIECMDLRIGRNR